MHIQQEIEQWDGQSTDDLGKIYECHSQDTFYIPTIIKCMHNTSFQIAATWLLKKYLEEKNEITQSAIAKIFNHLKSLKHWQSKLHILQSLPFLPIPKTNKNQVELFLRECLMKNNKYLRAWAYHGFYELAVQFPEYEKETRQFFEMALHDEAPSIKARIRNIMKKGF